MKKIIIFIGLVLLLSGCMKSNDEDIIKKLNDKISSSKSYQLIATLEIYRNEEKFTYDVESSYKKGDYFKVSLTNKSNNHKQIILKDKNSVYVLTPSLNKSFKFQSEWPYNNSQIYLLQPILKDIENDKNSCLEKTEKGYIITSKVNYSTENNFVKQKITLDKEKNITKIEILDNEDNVKMTLKIINIEYGIDFEKDHFNIDKYQVKEENNNLNEKESTTNEVKSSTVEEILYPMYVPVDTYLTSQDIVTTEDGERVILTFSGESTFTFIQENLASDKELDYVYGDPYLILDTVGAVTDYSVSWISNGIEYSVMSDVMPIDELLVVAQSLTVETAGK